MADERKTSGSELFIVDNSDRDWKVARYLRDWCRLSSSIDIATGNFEIGALLELDGDWQKVDQFRVLMGDEVTRRTKQAMLDGLRQITDRLDRSIESEKEQNDFLVGLPAVVDAFRCGKINARIYKKDKFHAKAYITRAREEVLGSFALVGSSNFSRPGLTNNVELNVQITGRQVSALQKWYNEHWDNAEDISEELLRVIERHTALFTPFDIWTKALFEFARDRGPSPDRWDTEHSVVFQKLATYQKHAYKNLVEIASRYGAAFLCDGVGLGKTYVGLMLLERMIAESGKRVVLFAPKAALEDVWSPLLDDLLPHLESDFQPLVRYSHTDLQRLGRWPDRIARTVKDADVILVDEAHHFRNPGVAGEGAKRASRYRQFQQYIHQPGSRPKQVYFLTATPINNTIHDFRHILGLVTNDQQDYFAQGVRNLGIHNLRAYFNRLEKQFHQQVSQVGEDIDLMDVLREIGDETEFFSELVVQRSRQYVRQSQSLESGDTVLFPDREAPRVADYQLKITYGRLLDAVATAFDRDKPLFALAIYNPLSYLIDKPSEEDFEVGRQKQVVSLIRTLFLKRFESSAKAFETSCWRLLHRLLTWAEVHAAERHDRHRLDRWKIKEKRLLEHVGHFSSRQHEFWSDDDGLGDFVSDSDLAEVEELDPNVYRVGEMFNDTLDDLEQVAEFLKLVRDVRPERDSKLTALTKLLRDNPDLDCQKVIIFTEFSDTAEYLEEQLRAKGFERIERIDGSSNQKQRSAVIRRFSPVYNNMNPPPKDEAIDILIATDVLAEGLNLQDANRLINFDLHWNPVRLMQRIGRVDRRRDEGKEALILATSPHLMEKRGTIVYWNFLPPDELEILLRIYKRVKGKTLVISKAFGIEGRKLLHPEDEFDPVKEINEHFEGEESVSEKLTIEYEKLVKDAPELIERLAGMPLRAFSGRECINPGTRAVFFCYRIPRPDPQITDSETDEPAWTEAAGDTLWLLYSLSDEQILTSPAEIARYIRSTPNTSRRCKIEQKTLVDIRRKIDKHIKNTHLKALQAPLTVKPSLKAWMELN